MLDSIRTHSSGALPWCWIRCFIHHRQTARLHHWGVLFSYFTLTVLTSHNLRCSEWWSLFKPRDHRENAYRNIGCHTADTLFTSVSPIMPLSRHKYSIIHTRTHTHTHKYRQSHADINMYMHTKKVQYACSLTHVKTCEYTHGLVSTLGGDVWIGGFGRPLPENFESQTLNSCFLVNSMHQFVPSLHNLWCKCL